MMRVGRIRRIIARRQHRTWTPLAIETSPRLRQRQARRENQ